MAKKWFGFLAMFLWVSLIITSCRFAPPVDPAERLAELDALLAAGAYGEVNSLLIWHDGALVMESYYRDTGPETMNQVYSVTKSVTSAAFGQALAAQAITSPDEPIWLYFAGCDAVDDLDGFKHTITLEDLLTMRAGFAWDEVSATYGDPANDVTRMTDSRDWVQYTLSKEMAAEPGTTFAYNSGVTMLLGVILAEATGQSVGTYVDTHLFAPLHITTWYWEDIPGGATNTGWGLYLRPADMLKFGRLYLQEGRWQGEQIVPAAWVEQSTASQVRIDEAHDYGYQWWRFADQNPVVADLAVNDLYFAWGFGGNFIFVVPHLDLVVVTTAENFENGEQFFAALPDYIFPAFR